MVRLPKGVRRLFDIESHGPSETDVQSEVDFHLDMKARELIEQGLEPGEALKEARRLFGDAERVKGTLNRQARRAEPGHRLSSWLHDGGSLLVILAARAGGGDGQPQKHECARRQSQEPAPRMAECVLCPVKRRLLDVGHCHGLTVLGLRVAVKKSEPPWWTISPAT